MSLKRNIIDAVKNVYGWKTKRKIVVFSVDDYGNVRLDSKAAREKMDAQGVKSNSRFDSFDTLETKEDLMVLFDTLSSVKDKNGRNAVFTPFALPCNIDFEKMAQEDFSKYHYELLPDTYKKLASLEPQAYEGAWDLWKEGIDKKIMVPQFHGREHFNLKVFNEKLKAKENTLMVSLKNRSNTSVISNEYPTIGYTAAFEFWEFDENVQFENIITDGLNAFEKVYGYRAESFNAPGASEHPFIHKVLQENGIKYIDTPWVKKEHLGRGKYKTVINHTGKKNKLGMTFLVRNVVFEPSETSVNDWVGNTMSQIDAAFRFNKPAIISSHRVNFCGHVSTQNRDKGINDLSALLKSIIKKWPDVEFMSADQLAALIQR